jgi:hypothetical protein
MASSIAFQQAGGSRQRAAAISRISHFAFNIAFAVKCLLNQNDK